jgi:hypothetical protein
MASETLRQELPGFEDDWMQAAGALNVFSVGSQIPRESRAIRKAMHLVQYRRMAQGLAMRQFLDGRCLGNHR